MNWKCGLAIAVPWALLIAALLIGRSCQDDWEAKDMERVEEIGRYVFLAKAAHEKAAIAAADANAAKAKLAELEAETGTLITAIKKEPRPHEVCRVPIARRERIIQKQQEQIDIHKATEETLWLAREHDLEEIKNLRTALELQGDRAEGWKKSAKRNRRDKILIGTFSAIGGAGVMALGVWGAGQL